MSGLTVIGDIQVLYDSVEKLESKIKKEQKDFAKDHKKVLAEILDRLEKLESQVYENSVLNLPDTSWENVRAKRNYLLKSSDWTSVSGCTVSPLEWSEYRQYLRDLPQTFFGAAPMEVVWPEPPSTKGPHTLILEQEV
jgi:uncharacterized protein (DUF608 family)